ncbi:hypothetical protein KDA_17040 [Dictyobacter alpinus]|uniref:IPT/TIG domain-containing protein n=2 Tax=Dictyobacter alpinus TaxID=2014873 RepID=A0A402B4G0_9CHLR|nr:hypothetical protein KDA_17040 [Dictyobacter alpinus]
MHFKRTILATVTLCMLISFTFLGSIFIPTSNRIAHAATISAPTIALSSKTAHIGQTLTLTGQGLAPQTDYQLALMLNGQGLRMLGGYFLTDGNGNLSKTFTFMEDNSSLIQGTYMVNLYPTDIYYNTPFIAQTSIQVVPAITPITGNPGLPITMRGTGFNAFETVQIFFGDSITGTSEGTTTSNEDGGVSFSFSMPAHLIPGSYPVTIVRSNKKPATVKGQIRVYPLTLSAPGGSKPHQIITVRGTGFAPNEYVNLTWNANGGQQLYNDAADSKGAFRFDVQLSPASSGTYTLQATGTLSNLSVTTSINVGPGISLYHPHYYDGDTNPGGTIEVDGGGFNANEQVDLYFQNVKNGVTTVTTDSTGSIAANITVPFQYSPTTKYYIYAKNKAATISVRSPFTFRPQGVGIDDGNGRITIGGFGANEQVQIVNHYQQPDQSNIATITADAEGNGIMLITWPSTPLGKTIPMAAIGQTTNLIATSTYSVEPTILAENATPENVIGKAGDVVRFAGQNFGANETINITFNDKVVATTTSQSDGSYEAAVTIPAIESVSTGPGNALVKAVGVTSGLIAGNSWNTTTFYYQPTLTITPTTGPSGTTITVTGTHFLAGVQIPVGWDGPFTADPDLWYYPQGTYVVVNTDQNGSFTATILANDLVSGQTYHVTATLSWPPIQPTTTFIAQ